MCLYTYILLLGSCLVLNLSYSGCCVWLLSSSCLNNGCYFDENCHKSNDCCNDIADIGCHPTSPSSRTVSPTPTNTSGKTKLEPH